MRHFQRCRNQSLSGVKCRLAFPGEYMRIGPFIGATFVAVLALSGTASAKGKLSCNDLTTAIIQLDDVITQLTDRDMVIAGSGYDRSLRIAAETALWLANIEGNSALQRYAKGMISGWEQKDIDRYIANGDEMIIIYDHLYRRDC